MFGRLFTGALGDFGKNVNMSVKSSLSLLTRLSLFAIVCSGEQRFSVATYNIWNVMFNWEIRQLRIAQMVRSHTTPMSIMTLTVFPASPKVEHTLVLICMEKEGAFSFEVHGFQQKVHGKGPRRHGPDFHPRGTSIRALEHQIGILGYHLKWVDIGS